MAIKPTKSDEAVTNKKNDTSKKTEKKSGRTKKILLNDELVSQYLIQNPEFFIRNVKQIEQMNIPHPIRGVISLSEWQLTRQRNRIRDLESEITLLMEQASANELLFASFMRVQNELVQATDLNDLAERLNVWAKSLGLVSAAIYLFDDKWQLGAPLNYQHFALSAEKFEFIRVRHLQHSNQYLGPLNITELNILVPEKVYVGSVALSMLGQFADLGVVVFVSRNPYHYQAGQGTLLLEKISDILPLLINRWIMRKP